MFFEWDTPLSAKEVCRTYGGSHELTSTKSGLGGGSQSQSKQKANFHYALIRYLYNEKDCNKLWI